MTGLVVDTSALVAILSGEPGADWLEHQLADADERLICAATAVELGIVLEARRPRAVGMAGRVLREARIATVSLDDDLAQRAMDGWRRFGKGRHRAALNLGDCFTYALAHREQMPVLCTGTDFARTDVDALTPPRPRRGSGAV